MQFTFNALALVAISSLVAAQGIPDCAKPLIDAASTKACGSTTLFCCLCTEENKAAIQAEVAPALLASDSPCPASEIPNVLSGALAMCEGVTTPCAASTSEDTPEPTSTETPEPTSSEEPTEPTTTADAETTTAYPTETASVTIETSTYIAGTGGSSGLPAPTSSQPPFTGAAAQATAAAGMVFAGAMAMLAAI